MKGVELYGQVRRAVYVERLSRREAARQFGIDPRTVAKMLAFSVPPGYRRGRPRRGRSWIRSSGSSIGSWPRIRNGRQRQGQDRRVGGLCAAQLHDACSRPLSSRGRDCLRRQLRLQRSLYFGRGAIQPLTRMHENDGSRRFKSSPLRQAARIFCLHFGEG